MLAQEPKEILTIVWRGKDVGLLVDAIPDMWHLEGRFEPNCTETAAEFVAIASGFNLKKVWRKPELGTHALLHSNLSPVPTHCVIISLTEDILFLRRVFDSKAVEWLLENVD